MALGETEVGEGGQLLPDGVSGLAGDPPVGHPLVEAGAEAFHAGGGSFRAHGLAKLVGLRRREPGGVDRHLHELLLEQRHPEGLLQAPLETGMQERHLLRPVTPAQVGMDRPSLDRSGADEGDLDDEVVETARSQPGQRGHLRPALHLEEPNRVTAAQHVVDRILLGDHGEVDLVVVVGGDGVDGPVDRLEHPEAEKVELHETDCRGVVLVPLEHGPVLHARPLDRADLRDRPVADHHAAGMDAEVAGKALQLGRHRQHPGRDPELARGLPGAGFDGDVVTTRAAVAGPAGPAGPAGRRRPACCLALGGGAPPRPAVLAVRRGGLVGATE